jgi:peptidoglycan/LPS O-acetylase OafA/YrhL
LSEHKTDIESLRGVAVPSVTVYPELVRDGFVGVDVCFALPGYLITGLVWDALASGRSSLRTSYQRRVLRLFPALRTVLLLCPFAALFTLPKRGRADRHAAGCQRGLFVEYRVMTEKAPDVA